MMRRDWLCGPVLLLMGIQSMPVRAERPGIQIALLPTLNWLSAPSGESHPAPRAYEGLDGNTLARELMDVADTAPGRYGAGASLQVSLELVSRDLFSCFLWAQGGIVANSINAQLSGQPLVTKTLLSWDALLGGTFRLDIDKLAFQDRSATRLGAGLEFGLGLTGAHINPLALNPSGLRQPQVDIALVQGALSMGVHVGLVLDYRLTQRWIIGVTVAWDGPANSPPDIRTIRYSDGSAVSEVVKSGYITVGARIALRL